jgi:predicted NAD/FAD-binding protein
VPKTEGRSIAVVGSGVAGLTAAFVLSGRDRVTLYETGTRLGGHAHAHAIDRGDGTVIGLDSAFLVHNDRTYPTLCRSFDELGVGTQESDMSMSVRAEASGLEYAGALGARGLFASWHSARPRDLRMLVEINRFHRAAHRVPGDDGDADDLETLDAFLRRHRFSAFFIAHFITPLVAAVWSCSSSDALRYPARYLFVFLGHHRMLSVFDSPTWRMVTGGSAHYVQTVAERLHEVRLGNPVRVAAHPDQVLALLDAPSRQERAVLGAITYSTNHAQLHTDEPVLPRRRNARASWNYLIRPNDDHVLVTYDISWLMRMAADWPAHSARTEALAC